MFRHRSITPSIILATALVILGSQSLSADCVSAILANEVYYSCSGVLTVVPKEAGQAVGLTGGEELQKSVTESERYEREPPENKERPVPRLP